jgi:hypothetical protein
MAAESHRLRRAGLSILNPQSWWDHLFVLLALRLERLWDKRAFKLLSTLPSAAFRMFVWGVSPALDLNYEHKPHWKRILAVAAAAAVAAFVFSFLFNLLFAWVAGTHYGHDENRLYFLRDIHNIGIYAIIAPIYIACSSAIIFVYMGSALFLRRYEEDISRQNILQMTLHFITFAVLVLGSAALVQKFYFSEIIENYGSLPHMKDPKYKHCLGLTYWFAERVSQDKLMLNISGVFYFIGNFVRLAVVAAAAFCFIAASASLIRHGLRIGRDSAAVPDILKVREELYSFSIIELWTKGLYFILSIHSKVWSSSCLSGDFNIRVAGVVLFIIGWVALTIPRNFVEYRLWRALHKDRAEERDGLPDLRTQELSWAYTAAASAFYLAAGALLWFGFDGPNWVKSVLVFLNLLGLGSLLPVFRI